jgi:hypothetical protein
MTPEGGLKNEAPTRAYSSPGSVNAGPTRPARLDAWAFQYANARVLEGTTPFDAAAEAWDEYGLHGGDRQAFIDRVEAAHISSTGTEGIA